MRMSVRVGTSFRCGQIRMGSRAGDKIGVPNTFTVYDKITDMVKS